MDELITEVKANPNHFTPWLKDILNKFDFWLWK
jgi:isopentenyldiphosphate isomerase